ncbi:hypothetical protein [Eubacterium sp. OM08-24]|nr:hypothetical protein [Eubacterium sp. OM08-24]
MGRAHKSFIYNILSGANSFAVLRAKAMFEKQATAFYKRNN